MLNNVILVGRTVDEPKLVTLKDGVVVCNLTLAVVRPFKSQDTGEYETDFIPVVLWRGIAESVVEYCKKGSIIGVKGRLMMKFIEVDNKKYKTIEVIGERVTFINLK
ncbi:MAG: single-stranded DNA-binding protein [Acholeplasmataceae bacterium]|nr:single-stranded DNA-binding protein [Acholeplasmataceae bacterium]HOA63929.1 single-stranded DNA-binding protein [Bacilli bacterium]HPT89032.1 single-stranded DNA-binding protein [Bacilli bacterium]HQA19600.1 single-stranded DNA-binding protein [Bacilli bacterium]HQD92656.1 single-stranded DNA-binding protein [Bacilli bacterium]